jgi:hypothetical protein
MHEPRRRGDATRRAPTPEEDEEEQQEPPPRTPTVDLLQNRPYLMTEDWGGPAVQPLAGLGRAEELNNCFAVAEEDRTRMVREAQGRMFPARRRVLELHTPPKQAAEKRAESWSLGPGWGEGKLGREGLQQRRVDWERRAAEAAAVYRAADEQSDQDPTEAEGPDGWQAAPDPPQDH